MAMCPLQKSGYTNQKTFFKVIPRAEEPQDPEQKRALDGTLVTLAGLCRRNS